MNIENTENSLALSRKPKNIKYYNRRLVLSLLRKADIMSASEISDRINLSITSVTKILSALQKQKLVKSMGKGSSTQEGGKKPELFALNDVYKYVITVCSGGDLIQCALATLKCRIVDKDSYRYIEPDNFKRCMMDISDCINQLVTSNGLKAADICGIAVGFDGIVDSENGVLLFPIHNTSWGRNLPARQVLNDQLQDYRNIIINNGSRLSGYAELLQHSNYAQENVLVITTGSFTGGCVLDHGKLMQGANGFVGEVGHVTVEPSYRSEKCACGNYGCFEIMISPKTLINYAKEVQGTFQNSSLIPIRSHLQYEDVFEASNQKDSFACQIMDHIINYFVLLIRDIVLIYDPKIIVLQGIYSQAGDYFNNALQKEIYSLPFFKIEKELKIEYSTLAFDHGCFIGGALYLADQFFNESEIFSEQEIECI